MLVFFYANGSDFDPFVMPVRQYLGRPRSPRHLRRPRRRRRPGGKISAMAKAAAAVILLSLLLISSIPTSHCSKKKQAAAARREDIPFIKCQVCQKLASQLHRQVKSKEAQISPKKISEYEVIELAENLCNLKKEEGDWIFRIDIVEKGDVLELVEQESEGECNTECKTIEKACQEVK